MCQADQWPNGRIGHPSARRPPASEYDARLYKRAAELAAGQRSNIDPALYDPAWYREQDAELSRAVRQWLDPDTARRAELPLAFTTRDRDLARHLDLALSHPLGTDLFAALVRAAAAGAMLAHIRASRRHVVRRQDR